MAIGAETKAQVQEFLIVLRKRRWQIVMPALYVLALGSIFAVMVPKKFVVTTRVEIKEPPQFDAQARGRNPEESATVREIQSANQHIKHDARIRRVIDEQGDLWADYVHLDHVDQGRYIRRVTKNIKVETIQKLKNYGSTFIDISYADVDGERAERFLNRLTQVWIEEIVERDKTIQGAEKEVLQNEVDTAFGEQRERMLKYRDLAKQMGIDPSVPLTNRERLNDRVFRAQDTVEREYDDTDVDLAQAREELKSLRTRYDNEEEKILVPVTQTGRDFNRQISEAQAQIARLRDKQRRLKPSHSKYNKYETDIALLEQSIKEAEALTREDKVNWVPELNPKKLELDTAVQKKSAEVDGLVAKLARLDKRKSELRTQTRKRSDDYSDLEELYQLKENAVKDYNEKAAMLSRKIGKLNILNDAYGDPYDIAREPEAASAPTKPNPWFIIIFSAFAGLALGLSTSLVAEYGRNSYRHPLELAEVMSAPVLGTINAIVTTGEARKVHFRRAVVGLSSAVILGGLAWFTWVWLESPDKLPVEVQQAIEEFREMLM